MVHDRVIKIISGGQTGADRAALDFAIKHKLPYGGWVPKGRKTEDGTLPEKYHLQEMPTGQYSKRTEKNVLDSDGTLIISHGLLTGGSALTTSFAELHKKPWIHIDLEMASYSDAAKMIHEWVERNGINILNVAGPRARKDPMIYRAVMDLLEEVLAERDSSIVAISENPSPLTVEEAVDRLHANISLNDEIRLATVTEDDLSDFHFSLGHHIRNEFGLWSGNAALLESCRVIAGRQDLHVDDASAIIIKALWERLKKEDRLNIIQS